MAGIADLGNGLGYIYVVEPDKTTIVKSISNDPEGARNVKLEGVKAQSTALNRVATGVITLNAPTGVGNITKIDISTVTQIDIGTPIPYTGATSAEDLAVLIRDAINSYTSSVNYTATAVGNIVTVIADADLGGTVNGDSIVVASTGFLTYTSTNVEGGSDATELYDQAIGYTFFINADYDSSGCSCDTSLASPENLTNAVEITEYIVPRSLTSSLDAQDVTIVSGSISFTRKSAITSITVDTESSSATDDLDTISVVGFAEADRIVFVGANTGRVVTFKDATGNINLQSEFDTSDKDTSIELQLVDGEWYEIGRSTQSIGSIADYRAAGYGIFGVELRGTQAVLTNGAVTWDVDVDGKIQDITGTSTLTANLVYQASGSYKDGDEFWVRYDASVVTSGFNLEIMDVILTEEQALNGGLVIYSRYVGAAARWQSYLTVNLDSAETNTFQSGTEFYKDGSVTTDKVSNPLKTEVLVVPVSWDTNRLGDYKIKLPYACTVEEINAWATDTVEATDDADLDFKNNALSSMGSQSLAAGTLIGSGITTITPTSNNVFAADEMLTVTSTKSTPGGNCLVSIKVIKS